VSAPGATGRLWGVGVGPGDPELMTLKAVRVIQECTVVASFSAVRRPSNARRVAASHLTSHHEELRFVYPVTTEVLPEGISYDTLLRDFYESTAKQVAEVLVGGRDVAVLCEGDPFLFGSFMYLHSRLASHHPTAVVPGVSSVIAAASSVGIPLACRDEVLTVLAGTLPVDELSARLRATDVAVVMKVGRNLTKVREAVERAGLLDDAFYVERASMENEIVVPLSRTDGIDAPYFSLVVVPSRSAGDR
jgi:precorrin-2/cobalt-factor-2 C20-methyltransferase